MTLNEAYVNIITDGEGVMVNDANVIDADILASNGIIHVIDAVLLPPPLETDTGASGDKEEEDYEMDPEEPPMKKPTKPASNSKKSSKATKIFKSKSTKSTKSSSKSTKSSNSHSSKSRK